MSIFKRGIICVALLAAVTGAIVASPASAAEAPLYESDPTLSLLGSCETIGGIDPIPDPSCSGEPLAYPPPPAGPTPSNCDKKMVCTSRFEEPRALAIDPNGYEYVSSYADGDDARGRVDVFDDEGKFITEVNVPDVKTLAVDSEGNLYVFKDLGEVFRYSPSEYKPEEGIIKYGIAPVLVASGAFQGSVAVDAATDELLIARDEVFRYKSAAEGNAFVKAYKPAGVSWTETMAIDAQRRRIYVSFCKSGNEECGIKVLNADEPTEVLQTIDGSTVPAEEFAALSGRLSVAVDEGTGDFFIADPPVAKFYRFNEEYEFLSQQPFGELAAEARLAISNGTRSLSAEPCDYPTSPPPAAGDACNRHYLFVSVFKSKGRVAAFHPPGQIPPVIEGVATAGIGATEAQLGATIFPGGLSTEYHFEITTLAAWEANGFTGATMIPGGTIPAESLAAKVTAFATGLTSGQSYRFRAVATNSLGPADEEGQNEATFATYDDASIVTGCTNEALRVGSSALLPDCRAYELVTPADTNGRAPKGTSFPGSLFSVLQASPTGEAVSFKIEGGSLPGTTGVGSFYGDPYVARRSASGWSSELSGPTGAEVTQSAPGGFSPDQSYTTWRSIGTGPLGPVGSIYAEYLHYPDGHSELLARGSEGSDPTALAKLITEDGAHVVFSTENESSKEPVKLEPDAPPTGTTAVYDRTIGPKGEEETHTVSLLPGDVTPAAGQNAFFQGASADAEGIAFSISTKPSGAEGTLYLRVNNETTYKIGEKVEFAGVSEGGARIFYVEGGNLEAFDVASEEVIDFAATGDAVAVNVANDGSRAYFVSEEVLGGTNPEGAEAQAGEQNLYLSEEGEISFVATVTDRDVDGEKPPLEAELADGLGLWTEVVGGQVAKDPSRLNPDGSVLLFQSRANITGYPESEFPQIYRYDTGAGSLQCISCIPTKTPASGGASLESYTFDPISTPNPFTPYGFVPNLTPDGNRVFFDSTEALVSRDSDKVSDVYEWEANGVGSCAQPQGCVYLISTGQSQQPNFLYGHSSDGRDVFFTTTDTLTGWDSASGSPSIYDARVGGGFPEPVNPGICVGDGCRPSVTPAPVFEKPRAGGDGDVPPRSKSCPKGKRKVKKNGKVQCVKKKQKKHKGGNANKRAGANRGAGK
ncbi:MAG TPA: hypothetical protein VFS54_03135 [Solirubrobacterales bacterium]|nr:hypothetical protein [Solirubrobacterales bacterium]